MMKFSLNLNKLSPFKKLAQGQNKKSGHNNKGRITVGQRGGGNKQKYRIVDFDRAFTEKGIVLNVEYDPNRSAHIAKLFLASTRSIKYVISPRGLKILDDISLKYLNKQSLNATLKTGDTFMLKDIPVGSIIHNIELHEKEGGKFARSAGTFAQVLQLNERYARIKLMSGEHRFIPINCKATLGIVSNEKYASIVLGKAGKSRWLNRRPIVRGTAMNPVDHPHGGGAGKAASGRPSVSPWGRLTKGAPTRSKRKNNKLILIKARNVRSKK